MATIRPTLQEIKDRVDNETTSRLDNTQLRRSDIVVFKTIISSVAHSLYSAIEYGRRQLFIDSCEVSYLERVASIWGLSRKQATKAKGFVKFSYAQDVSDIPLHTVIQTDTGLQYETISSPDSQGVATVRALEAGQIYNISKNVELSLPTPLVGVINAVTTGEITGGTDTETDDSLRARVLEHTQNPPRQGTKDDYIAWCREVEGVGQAWCYPQEQGKGTVTMRILDDNMNLPDSELISKVQQHLDLMSNIMATVFVVAPVPQPFNFKLKIKPNNLTMREQAEQAIRDVFKEESVPGGKIYLSHLNLAISKLTDEIDHVIVEPKLDIQAQGTQYLPTVGEITWQEDD